MCPNTPKYIINNSYASDDSHDITRLLSLIIIIMLLSLVVKIEWYRLLISDKGNIMINRPNWYLPIPSA